MKGRLFEFFAFSFLGAALLVSGGDFLKAEDGEKKGLIMEDLVNAFKNGGLGSHGVTIFDGYSVHGVIQV